MQSVSRRRRGGLPDAGGGATEAEARKNPTLAAQRAEAVEAAIRACMMAGGVDLRPDHYVTFWEALGTMTSKYLKPEDWEIEF